MTYNKFGSYYNPKCFLGNLDKPNTSVLIFGDSHAMADQGMISLWLSSIKEKGYIYTKSLSLDKHTRDILFNSNFSHDIEYYLKKFHPSVVIMAGAWRYYKLIPNSINNVEKSIPVIIKYHATPIVILDVPSLQSIEPHCGMDVVSKILLSKDQINDKCSINKQDDGGKRIFTTIKRRYPKLIVIDPTKAFVVIVFVIPQQITNLYIMISSI